MILYAAAHGGFREAVPLGGGAAICDQLVDEWTQAKPFEFRLIRPEVQARDIVKFSEREYAKFSRQFERKATEKILKHDPKTTAVLVNDVSEGPDFKALRDYRLYTIYRVDVVAYEARHLFPRPGHARNNGEAASPLSLGDACDLEAGLGEAGGERTLTPGD